MPTLPIDQIRHAIASDDWSAATELLRLHDLAVREACNDAARPPARAEIEALLQVHRVLHEEMLQARNAAADALAQMQGGRRGVKAYLGSAA